MSALHALRAFYQPGRYMSATEDATNATARYLSTHTDEAVAALRAGAVAFIAECDGLLLDRGAVATPAAPAPQRPAVLIFVHGGVADFQTVGDVDVELIDADDIDAGGSPPTLTGNLLALARNLGDESLYTEGQS